MVAYVHYKRRRWILFIIHWKLCKISGTCSNRRFQGFDEKKKKKILTSTAFIMGPGRRYNSDSLYTVLNTLRYALLWKKLVVLSGRHSTEAHIQRAPWIMWKYSFSLIIVPIQCTSIVSSSLKFSLAVLNFAGNERFPLPLGKD